MALKHNSELLIERTDRLFVSYMRVFSVHVFVPVKMIGFLYDCVCAGAIVGDSSWGGKEINASPIVLCIMLFSVNSFLWGHN